MLVQEAGPLPRDTEQTDPRASEFTLLEETDTLFVMGIIRIKYQLLNSLKTGLKFSEERSEWGNPSEVCWFCRSPQFGSPSWRRSRFQGNESLGQLLPTHNLTR